MLVNGAAGTLARRGWTLWLVLALAACTVDAVPSGALDALDGASDVGTRQDLTGSADLPADPIEVRIATWNISRFFDTVCDSGDCDPWDYEYVPDAQEFKFKKNTSAAAISLIDADIVLLQEVENDDCVDALAAALEGRYPTQVIGETGGGGSLDVVVFADGVHLETRTHRQQSIPLPSGGFSSFTRELLEIHLDMDGWRVIVLNAHFKSKTNDDSERRLAEAMAARAIILDVAEEFPDALVVFGGDLNDSPNSPPLNALEEDGLLDRVASDVLGSGGAWTYLFSAQKVAIDHLYLAVGARGVYVPGTAEVIRDNNVTVGDSDHAALRATFWLAPDGVPPDDSGQ